jgi:pimeloyl-ACP methyl ester carboxylesterase
MLTFQPGEHVTGQSIPKAASDFAQLAHTRLTMPVLTIGGEKASGDTLGRQFRLVATNVTSVVIKDSGHWLMEEKPKETSEALLKFL